VVGWWCFVVGQAQQVLPSCRKPRTLDGNKALQQDTWCLYSLIYSNSKSVVSVRLLGQIDAWNCQQAFLHKTNPSNVVAAQQANKQQTTSRPPSNLPQHHSLATRTSRQVAPTPAQPDNSPSLPVPLLLGNPSCRNHRCGYVALPRRVQVLSSAAAGGLEFCRDSAGSV
jgi:hypothetical protein